MRPQGGAGDRAAQPHGGVLGAESAHWPLTRRQRALATIAAKPHTAARRSGCGGPQVRRGSSTWASLPARSAGAGAGASTAGWERNGVP